MYMWTFLVVLCGPRLCGPTGFGVSQFQLGALKAPGRDGMLAIFYQHCWDIVGSELVDVVLSFFFLKWSYAEVNEPYPISPCPKSSPSRKH